jgi:outer membrane assembly lipoprotein YfgL
MKPGHLSIRFATVSVLLAATLLAACSSTDKRQPVALEAITPKIAGRMVWSGKVDAVQFPLAVAVSPGVFTVAGNDGSVLALQADTGRELWRGSAGAKLSAGVGSDGRFAAVVTRDDELVTLEAGRTLWRKPLGIRVLTAPLVAGERVFVLGVDRSVHAFDAQDGTKLWSVQRPGDPLTLSQGGVLAAFKDTLLAGQGARLAGLDPGNGNVRWEVIIGSPRGTNEVERLADLVAPAARIGDQVCARSFQAAVGCVNAERGALLWTKPIGGTDGVTGDDQFVLAADASDRITAWKTATGEVAWTSEKLLYHGLAAPLLISKTVIFGDSDGILHFIARDTGEALLRLPTDGTAIAAAPVVSGTTMLAVTKSGGLFAFRPE